jgi:hypothetical protein
LSAYTDVLAVARQQLAAASEGDLETAARLLHDRQLLLDGAGTSQPADERAIRQILAIDRQVAGYFRERMLKIRDEALALSRGRHALTGYRPSVPPAYRRIDTQR